MFKTCLLLFLWLLSGASLMYAQTPGEKFPEWSPGYLDLHHISTGRGDAAFYVFPDGTTMLFDAGEITDDGPAWRLPRYVSPRPDGSRTAGEWITRYIKRRLAGAEHPVIDYGLLSHFHGDHMGSISSRSVDSEKGPYKLTGITYVGEHIPIKTMMDHGWPDYDYPFVQDAPEMVNYRNFLEWQTEHNELTAAAFLSGRHDQITLVHKRNQYPTFRVQNIAANGKVWTGVEQVARAHFPPLKDLKPEDYPTENISSVAFRLSYGQFDYYSGGDLYGIPPLGAPGWHDIETPVAQAVGPVEIATLNHHGYVDSQNEYFVSTLRPRAWLVQVWDSAHPSPMVYQRLQSEYLYPGPRDIFSTQMHPSNKEVVVGLDELKSDGGHVVVRVAPGGATYQIIIIDDSTEEDVVVAIHGPFESR